METSLKGEKFAPVRGEFFSLGAVLYGKNTISKLCVLHMCYDIKPVRKEEGKSYWKIPLCDDDATREK